MEKIRTIIRVAMQNTLVPKSWLSSWNWLPHILLALFLSKYWLIFMIPDSDACFIFILFCLQDMFIFWLFAALNFNQLIWFLIFWVTTTWSFFIVEVYFQQRRFFLTRNFIQILWSFNTLQILVTLLIFSRGLHPATSQNTISSWRQQALPGDAFLKLAFMNLRRYHY